jgi:hypothetical protein
VLSLLEVSPSVFLSSGQSSCCQVFLVTDLRLHLRLTELETSLPITFGVAPSTLLSRQESEAERKPEVFKAKM